MDTLVMKQKSLLMPYSCQKAGWIIALAIPFVPIAYVLFAKFFDHSVIESESFFHWMVAITILFFFVAIFLICMSKEKEEDEMIAQIRMRIVTVMVYIYFVLFLLIGMVWSFDIALGFVGEYQGEVLGNVLIRMSLFLVIYELIFKITLWRNKREIKSQEE